MGKSSDAIILVVEDSSTDAELIRRSLLACCQQDQIWHVQDGGSALRILRDPQAGPPRVVLLDIKLPGLSGLDVLEEIRADASLAHTPVVMLTSSAEGDDLGRAYELGANSYVVKPIDFVEFLDTVQQIGRYWLQVNQPP